MATALLSVVFASGLAFADQSPSEIPPVPDSARQDAYRFAVALAEGMGDYGYAEEALAHPVTGRGFTVDIISLLSAMRTCRAKWQFAAERIKPFAGSEDGYVAAAANALAFGYTGMADLHSQNVTLMEAILQQGSISADVAIEKSKLNSKAEQVFELVAVATSDAACPRGEVDRSKPAGGDLIYMSAIRRFDSSAPPIKSLPTHEIDACSWVSRQKGEIPRRRFDHVFASDGLMTFTANTWRRGEMTP